MSIKRKLLLMVFMIIGAFTLVTVYTVLSFYRYQGFLKSCLS